MVEGCGGGLAYHGSALVEEKGRRQRSMEANREGGQGPHRTVEPAKVRIVASTKGASGHYNSLGDITRPACKWLEWIKTFVNDLAEYTGYNPENACLAAIPGLYEVVNFHVKAQSHFRIARIPIAPYGIYKFEFRMSEKNNPNCYCMRVFMEVFPDAKTILRKQRMNRTKFQIH
ncbi:uncharacterized protein LOC120352232 [Nilaparvata lugens]|uniref:uncharacterized protein LOC120352232 n=1 Tax=Nilaparvata lugens TaxID=108931 RepID=UPI00193D6739|nr:uncharacterized protein LOC120352232 [Nilaparvata lugens]